MAYSSSTPLIAGGGSPASAVNIGSVELSLSDSGLLTVTYTSKGLLADSRDDWSLNSIHFDFGKDKISIPTTKTGNPQVGLFDFGGKQASFINTGDPTVVQFTVSGVAQSDLAYWAAHASVSQRDAISAFNQSLPDQVNFQLTDGPSAGDSSYWKTTVTGSSEAWMNTTFDGWCVDTGRTIGTGSTYRADVYSSIGDDLTGVIDKPQNLDRVNWLLNNANLMVGKSISNMYSYGSSDASCSDYQNGGTAAVYDTITGSAATDLGAITYADIQRAIWGLVTNNQSTSGLYGDYSAARADEIADRAYILGRGFMPACNQKAAVLFRPVDGSDNTTNQITIGQVTIISPSGSCDGRNDTAWAITGGIAGLGGDNRFGSSWAEYNRVI